MTTKNWVQGVGHSPLCQILLQTVVRAVITFSPLAWTSSAGMLSTPADFPFFNDCTAASTSVMGMSMITSVITGWGGRPLCLSGNSSVLMDLHWPCDCTAHSSILSIGSVSPVLRRILDSSSFPLFHSGEVFHEVDMPSYSCSSSDFLQFHYTVLPSFLFAFFMHPLM